MKYFWTAFWYVISDRSDFWHAFYIMICDGRVIALGLFLGCVFWLGEVAG